MNVTQDTTSPVVGFCMYLACNHTFHCAHPPCCCDRSHKHLDGLHHTVAASLMLTSMSLLTACHCLQHFRNFHSQTRQSHLALVVPNVIPGICLASRGPPVSLQRACWRARTYLTSQYMQPQAAVEQNYYEHS